MVPATAPHLETAEEVLRRIRQISLGAYFVFAAYVALAQGFAGLVALTCSGAVIMINFLWLEEIITQLLRPSPHLHAWRLTLRTLARFALLGVAVMVTIFVVRFDALSVLLGFSILVVGIMGEAVYSFCRTLDV